MKGGGGGSGNIPCEQVERQVSGPLGAHGYQVDARGHVWRQCVDLRGGHGGGRLDGGGWRVNRGAGRRWQGLQSSSTKVEWFVDDEEAHCTYQLRENASVDWAGEDRADDRRAEVAQTRAHGRHALQSLGRRTHLGGKGVSGGAQVGCAVYLTREFPCPNDFTFLSLVTLGGSPP